MAEQHISAPIVAFLEMSNDALADFFSASKSGQVIRRILEYKLANGEIYIGSESCNNFDPKMGCQCHKHPMDSNIIRATPKQLNT